MNIWGYCIELEDALGDGYIVHNYEAKGVIDVCRESELNVSTDGMDLIIARVVYNPGYLVTKLAQHIIIEFYRYDNGAHDNYMNYIQKISKGSLLSSNEYINKNYPHLNKRS